MIKPPPSLVEATENRKERKPKPKRKKEKHEYPTKKKLTRVGRIMHCGRCGLAGHNAMKCTTSLVQVNRLEKKSKKRQDGNTTQDVKRPSQPMSED